MIEFKPYEYQRRAIDWIIEKPCCALFLDMGLGKTVITLTAIQRLIDDGDISKVLVVAPKKVAETTWSSEAEKWAHLQPMRVSVVLGTAKQREAALNADADVYVTGRDNFVWLVGHYNGRLPFDAVVLDELTSFKTPKSQRTKAMKLARPYIGRVIGLTGTPAPNGLVDLWSQIYCLDMGERLGKSVTRYRSTYFDEYRHNGIPIRCTLKPGAEEKIRHRIDDICLSMQAKDYLELPDLIVSKVKVQLSKATKAAYDEFEREQVLEVSRQIDKGEDGATILATSAAALMNKLSQFANGAVYDEDHNVHTVHDEKVQRLVELVEEANGSPVLVYYQYRSDIGRIEEALKGYRVEVYKDGGNLKRWNAGNIDVLLAHPASTAYGLNMQEGGHYIVWFGTGWNLELYQQANARLHRQGQRHPVTVYQLIAADTVDERALKAISSKQSVQQTLLENLKDLREKYERTEEDKHIG